MNLYPQCIFSKRGMWSSNPAVALSDYIRLCWQTKKEPWQTQKSAGLSHIISSYSCVEKCTYLQYYMIFSVVSLTYTTHLGWLKKPAHIGCVWTHLYDLIIRKFHSTLEKERFCQPPQNLPHLYFYKAYVLKIHIQI